MAKEYGICAPARRFKYCHSSLLSLHLHDYSDDDNRSAYLRQWASCPYRWAFFLNSLKASLRRSLGGDLGRDGSIFDG